MNTQNQFGFLIKKIEELQTAILTSQTNTLLTSPSYLIETNFIDPCGHLWKATIKQSDNFIKIEQTFYVFLNIIKKINHSFKYIWSY